MGANMIINKGSWLDKQINANLDSLGAGVDNNRATTIPGIKSLSKILTRKRWWVGKALTGIKQQTPLALCAVNIQSAGQQLDNTKALHL